MKILHLSNVAGHKGGGISQVAHNLTKYQNIAGSESDLWFPGNSCLLNEIEFNERIDKQHLRNFWTIGNVRFGFTPELVFKRKFVVSNYNLIHQHGIFLPISIFTNSVGKKIKSIVSPHGLIDKEKFTISGKKKKIALNLYEYKNLSECDCLLACSMQEAEGFREFGLKKPIAILPNGVTENFIESKKSIMTGIDFRLKHNIDSNKNILLFLSRIHPFKGLDLLIDCVKEIKDIFLKSNWIVIIAGTDEVNYVTHLINEVKKNELDKIIKFIGPLYGQEKIIAMDTSDCFILPSKNENFGIVVVEALARGLPVITTLRTPWKELLDRECGWWILREKTTIIETLIKVISLTKDQLKLMGMNGISLVKEKYLWPSVTKQSIAIYNWVISEFNDEFKEGVFNYD